MTNEPGEKGGRTALDTPDYDAVAWLKQHGVTFLLEPTETGVCRFARFADSEGHHLVLHRRHDALPS